MFRVLGLCLLSLSVFVSGCFSLGSYRTAKPVEPGVVEVGVAYTATRFDPGTTTATVTNEESDFYTLVDVSADDRVGLLYDLTRTLGDNGIEIFVSKAATIRDQVADTFYVKDSQGKKLAPEKLAAVRGALLQAIETPLSDREEGEGG